MIYICQKPICVNLILYNIFLWVYKLAVWVVAPFNKKAKLWQTGRQSIFQKLRNSITENQAVIWMHCASLGEFEQGRPVIEKLKLAFPNHKILLTFFSPSGYEIRKNFNGADWVFYLPMDSRSNALEFIEIVKPRLAIFVKYEYWYHYLNTLNQKQIPAILISAIFRENAVFFKWYGGLHRKMLSFFDHVFVQNEESIKRIRGLVDEEKMTLAGDTRFDRVVSIVQTFEPIKPIESFLEGKRAIVAGSTWPDDEIHLQKLSKALKVDIKMILAPHEITPLHLQQIKKIFPDALFYSQLLQEENKPNQHNILVIDNIGMLSKLYYYSTISYIGGGFNKSGIHNSLEAAVYGRPVVFGPNYQKFGEAIELVNLKAGFSYKDENELLAIFTSLLENEDLLKLSSEAAGFYVRNSTGATEKIIKWLESNSF